MVTTLSYHYGISDSLIEEIFRKIHNLSITNYYTDFANIMQSPFFFTNEGNCD